ncbi:hypothetical protein [Alkalibaculum sporogenes]|uniref:hypothetical protein n=1 Tax=Alkalibaculum sporogenes TaxID=2655001 RepID=UPI001A9B8B92|nr:hypothetical protein [Alkalibaculum sporogenes]
MKKVDKVIIALVLLFSLSAMIILTLSRSFVSHNKIIIQVGNEIVKKISLNNTNESKNL